MYGRSGRRRHSKDVRLVRAGAYGGRRRGMDKMLMVFIGFIVVIFAVCAGALYFILRTESNDDVMQVSKGQQQPDLELVPDSNPQEDDTVPEESRAMIIAIDPGHGGWDNGCSRSGVTEQEVNLEIALLLKDKLQDLGYETVLIREDNDTHVGLEERVEKSKEAKADIYVSIHQNSYGEEGQDNSVTGVETYYATTNEDSIVLAQLVQTYVSEKTGARDRGIINMQTLHVIRENTCPSCLVETGFLTNAKERKALTTADYQEKIASGIAQGINEFLESKQQEAEKEKTF